MAMTSSVSLSFHNVTRIERRPSACDPNWFTLFVIQNKGDKEVETDILIFANASVVESVRD